MRLLAMFARELLAKARGMTDQQVIDEVQALGGDAAPIRRLLRGEHYDLPDAMRQELQDIFSELRDAPPDARRRAGAVWLLCLLRSASLPGSHRFACLMSEEFTRWVDMYMMKFRMSEQARATDDILALRAALCLGALPGEARLCGAEVTPPGGERWRSELRREAKARWDEIELDVRLACGAACPGDAQLNLRLGLLLAPARDRFLLACEDVQPELMGEAAKAEVGVTTPSGRVGLAACALRRTALRRAQRLVDRPQTLRSALACLDSGVALEVDATDSSGMEQEPKPTPAQRQRPGTPSDSEAADSCASPRDEPEAVSWQVPEELSGASADESERSSDEEAPTSLAELFVPGRTRGVSAGGLERDAAALCLRALGGASLGPRRLARFAEREARAAAAARLRRAKPVATNVDMVMRDLCPCGGPRVEKQLDQGAKDNYQATVKICTRCGAASR